MKRLPAILLLLLLPVIPSSAEDEYTWTSLGVGQYTDDCITAFFGVGNQTADVEIEECDQVAGFYRLIDPYRNFPTLVGAGTFDGSDEHHLYVHAENPEQVYIEECTTGYDPAGYGSVLVSSFAAYHLAAGYTPDRIASEFGTLTDGVITMPTNKMIVAMEDYNNAT